MGLSEEIFGAIIGVAPGNAGEIGPWQLPGSDLSRDMRIGITCIYKSQLFAVCLAANPSDNTVRGDDRQVVLSCRCDCLKAIWP